MTLTQKLNLRNLPCFTFSNIFNELVAIAGYLFPTLLLPLAKCFPAGKFNLYFLICFVFLLSTLTLISGLPFQRGAKIRSFSELPKVF